MQQQPCHRQPLASGDFSAVELCSCGSTHVTIGAVTLRLAPAAIAELARVLGDAARELALRELVIGRRPRLEILS